MRVRARLPVLGLCLGLQCIVIEAARSVGLTEANSAEFEPDTPDPVISTMADQEQIVAGEADLGGTMRLGAYPAVLEPDSIVAQAYQATQVSERHRHRYEVNNAYRERIAESGLRFRGTSPDGHLVEFVEYPPDQHPFIVGTQAHPELKSRPTRPHPLFVAFVRAAIDYKAGGAAARRNSRDPRAHASNGNEHRDKDGSAVRAAATRTRLPWLSTYSRRYRPKSSTREPFSRYAATRCGCRAATSRNAKSSSTTVRWRWWRWTKTTTFAMVYQYRHTYGRRIWELPAGLLDAAGEPPHLTAVRELEEEVGLHADTWQVLRRRQYRAGLQRRIGAGLSGHRAERRGPARGARRRSRHDDAVVLHRRGGPIGRCSGEIVNSIAIAGILAAHAVTTGFAQPRPLDTPWLDKPTAFAGAKGRAVTAASTLETRLQGYLDHLTIERGVAANTLSSYRRDLRRYSKHWSDGESTIWPRSARTTSASSWWRCAGGIPNPARCRCRRSRRRGR